MNFKKIKEFFGNLNPKFKNPVFWTSLVAIVFSAGGVEFSTLTSWVLLGNALLSIFSNPVALLAVIIAVIGVFNDNSSKGLDKPNLTNNK